LPLHQLQPIFFFPFDLGSFKEHYFKITKMRITFLLLSLAVVSAFAGTKDIVPTKENIAEVARSWFTTFTLIVGSQTSTTTVTSVTTCTTSTATLTTCTAGRRRRGLFYDEDSPRVRRGLFYREDEVKEIPAIEKRSTDGKEGDKSASNVEGDKSQTVGLEVQSGFSLPEGFSSNNRFGLTFGTTTIITTTTTVSTSTLTATCASTTNFPTCGSGK